MSEISVYLLSIVGVAVLAVLLDLVMGETKIAAYTKSIMGLVLVFVIIAPLPKLVKTKIDFLSFLNDNMNYNQEYIEVFNNQQKSVLENKLSNLLKQNGYSGVQIEIWGETFESSLKINYIFVDLTNLVISQNAQHINYYEAIKNLLIKETGVDEGQVVLSD